ncbi:hypothetical protein YWS52_11950 [Chitiniphilus shinanonensis]
MIAKAKAQTESYREQAGKLRQEPPEVEARWVVRTDRMRQWWVTGCVVVGASALVVGMAIG